VRLFPVANIGTLVVQGDTVVAEGVSYTIVGVENFLDHCEITALSSAAVVSGPEDANLISEWTFASGALGDDSLGTNFLTNINTVVYSSLSGTNAVPANGSAEFEEGNAERLEIADASQTGLDFTTAMSILGWIRLETLPSTLGAECAIVSKHDFSSQRSYQIGVYDASNKLQSRVSTDGGAGTQVTCAAGTALSTATWYSFALVFNSTDLRIYLNGVLDSNGSNNPKEFAGPLHSGTAKFCIGANSDNGAYFDGLIDNVRVYNIALSAAQVLSWHNTGSIS
jgi:hypothetical protein